MTQNYDSIVIFTQTNFCNEFLKGILDLGTTEEYNVRLDGLESFSALT